jgi:hypothetical protein
VNTAGIVFTDYFQLWPAQPEQVNEGAGGLSVLGSRLLPPSLFEEGNVDGLVNLLAQTRFVPIFHLGESHSILQT